MKEIVNASDTLTIYSEENVELCHLDCFYTSLCTSYLFLITFNRCFLFSNSEWSANFNEFTKRLQMTSSFPQNLESKFLKHTFYTDNATTLQNSTSEDSDDVDLELETKEIEESDISIYNRTFHAYHGVLNGKF